MGRLVHALALAVLVLLSGCTEPPISGNANLVVTYTFMEGGNLKIDAEYTGKANSRAGLWAGNCRAELGKNIDRYISLLESAGTEEQAALLGIGKAVRDRSDCEFIAAGDNSKLTVTATIMADEINRIGENDGSMNVQTEGGTIARIPFFKPSIFRMTGVRENLIKVKVAVDGSVRELSPEGYVREGDIYVYGNPSVLREESIIAAYGAKGIGIPIEILPGIVAAVALGTAGFFGFRFLKSRGFPKAEKGKPGSAEADADAERLAKGAVREIVRMSAREAVKARKGMPHGEGRIAKVVKTLEGQKGLYEPEEIVEALLSEGYKEKEAAEVIKRLYHVE